MSLAEPRHHRIPSSYGVHAYAYVHVISAPVRVFPFPWSTQLFSHPANYSKSSSFLQPGLSPSPLLQCQLCVQTRCFKRLPQFDPFIFNPPFIPVEAPTTYMPHSHCRFEFHPSTTPALLTTRATVSRLHGARSLIFTFLFSGSYF